MFFEELNVANFVNTRFFKLTNVPKNNGFKYTRFCLTCFAVFF